MDHDLDRPRLLLHPRAWLKWQFLCHAGPTEIGAFGLSDPHHPLVIEDLLVVRQAATAVSVSFDDAAVADLFDGMTDLAIPPHRYARVWLHTHPGASVEPSGVDEETFRRVFGHCDWAVMAILGRTGRTSARLRFNAGPGGSLEIPTSVDWPAWPEYAAAAEFTADLDRWQQEFEDLIEPVPLFSRDSGRKPNASASGIPLAAALDAWLMHGDSIHSHNPRSQHDEPGNPSGP